MKPGKTLQELLLEIERQAELKKDYLFDTATVSYVPAEDGDIIQAEGLSDTFHVKDIAHSQIGQHLEIPAKYYNRMRSESPELLATNVNHWFHSNPSQRMFRTLDGSLRAFLSNKYRRIDNAEIAETVLPILAEMPEVLIESCEITDSRMYIKAVNPRITTEVTKGDIVQSGIIISNSEVGQGSVNISPLVYRLVCSNGMIAQDDAVRKYHVGRAGEADSDFSIFRNETIEADDKAFLMKVEDAVRAAANQERFERIVGKLRESTEVKIEPVNVPKVVELASKPFNLTLKESEGILGHLIQGGDFSKYGLANAVTRHAQDVDSYDRSTELEATGYKIITMAPSLWHQITKV